MSIGGAKHTHLPACTQRRSNIFHRNVCMLQGFPFKNGAKGKCCRSTKDTCYRKNALSPRLETQKHHNKTAQAATSLFGKTSKYSRLSLGLGGEWVLIPSYPLSLTVRPLERFHAFDACKSIKTVKAKGDSCQMTCRKVHAVFLCFSSLGFILLSANIFTHILTFLVPRSTFPYCGENDKSFIKKTNTH